MHIRFKYCATGSSSLGSGYASCSATKCEASQNSPHMVKSDSQHAAYPSCRLALKKPVCPFIQILGQVLRPLANADGKAGLDTRLPGEHGEKLFPHAIV